MTGIPAASTEAHKRIKTDQPHTARIWNIWNEHGTPKLTQRTPADIARFFNGLELLDPGVVSCNHWRPDDGETVLPAEVAMFGGVGLKA
ncbi:SAM-dependent methyltransferase [Streptomyces sp. NPDC012935]|uniref:SAM-dependent methyltransferase n=1 Tax=Streptomyces sp. NPDC012935 TaxID=3364857 RepID=UPI0036C63306